jgi:hypothetical protein
MEKSLLQHLEPCSDTALYAFSAGRQSRDKQQTISDIHKPVCYAFAIFVQSNAIMKHIARKHNLVGRTIQEQVGEIMKYRLDLFAPPMTSL